MKQKFYSRSDDAPLFTIESTMNLAYQSVACAIVVKYYLMLGEKESRQ